MRFDLLTLHPNMCAGPLADAAGGEGGGAALRPPHSLATRYVALHPLPAGSEVHISYMPLGDEYRPRRKRLLDEYGFECDCARCRVEAADEMDEPTPEGLGDVDLTYVSLFILKHVCPDCLGTLAPEAQKRGKARASSSASYICNRCSTTSTEEDFMARCAAHFEGGGCDSDGCEDD